MNGLLIYDSADVSKNQWFINHFIEVSKEADITLKLIIASDFPANPGMLPFCPDFVVNRSRNYHISQLLEENDIQSFNSSGVINIGNDKNLTYQYFNERGIEHLPYLYITKNQILTDSYFDIIAKISEYPIVAKPSEGHGGAYVSLLNNGDEVISYLSTLKKELSSSSINYNSVILQKCATDIGKDLRVYVLGGKIIAGIMRQSNSDFRANFSLGGYTSSHKLTSDELQLTNQIISSLDADLIGIDFVYDNGLPVLNEIEDAVGCRMLYANTDIDIVKLYVNHIKNHIKTKKP